MIRIRRAEASDAAPLCRLAEAVGQEPGGWLLTTEMWRAVSDERRYLRAMATLGPGPHRSGDIAHQLRVKITSMGPVRAKLIAKGMIYSPSHGDTAFTVPLFDQFMRRIMPEGVDP